ncbi:MAG: hypothetical protein NTX59_08285 [Elusimicrobia bacterium]|nr:hypothetical protein [Elusimicrobiota bacterium]
MSDFNFWLEGIKNWGLPVAVLAAWFYHNRGQNKLWAQMLENNKTYTAEMIKTNSTQAAQTLENTNKIWSNVLDMVRQQWCQQNEVLKGLLENDQYHGAQLARIEQKIDTNQSCPMIRSDK